MTDLEDDDSWLSAFAFHSEPSDEPAERGVRHEKVAGRPWSAAFPWVGPGTSVPSPSFEAIVESIVDGHAQGRLGDLMPTLPLGVNLLASGLPTRAINVLGRLEVRTTDAIRSVTAENLWNARNAGRGTITSIVAKLVELALEAAEGRGGPTMLEADQGAWYGPVAADELETLGQMFPPLRLLEAVRLDAPELQRVASTHADQLALEWLRGRSGRESIGDLLSVTKADILLWPGVGLTRREGIVAFLGRVSSDAFLVAEGELPETADPDLEKAFTDAVEERSREQSVALLERIAAWVLTLTGNRTWGDLLSLADAPKPPEIQEAWSDFLSGMIPGGSIPSAQAVLDDYFEHMDPRRLAVLLGRVLAEDKRTLEELGAEFGVTRERMRQIESAAKTEIEHLFRDSPDWRSVGWAVEALRSQLGAMAPEKLSAEVLPALSPPARRVVIWLAGYRVMGDFLVQSDFQRPTVGDLPRLVPGGRVIDELEVLGMMDLAGVKDAFVDEVLTSVSGLHRVDGQLLDWTGSQVDKALSVLELRDEPQDVNQLFGVVGGSSEISFRNRIFEDQRIIRVTKTKVGLRSWGGTHYTSIVELMASRLSSGPQTVADLGQELESIYEVSPNSVAMYAYAPVFKLAGDTIALRSASDPYVPRNKPQAVQGMFIDGSGDLIWHVVVDADILRGSGRPLPQEIGTYLGVVPGRPPLELASEFGSIPVSWPETSHTGPHIGSLRPEAIGLGAGLGKTLRLRFTHSQPRLGVAVVPSASADEPPSERLSRLTGLELSICRDLDGLARAIQVSADEALATLRRRKDDAIADAAAAVARQGRV